jgi:hypothetical protein
MNIIRDVGKLSSLQRGAERHIHIKRILLSTLLLNKGTVHVQKTHLKKKKYLGTGQVDALPLSQNTVVLDLCIDSYSQAKCARIESADRR